METSLKPKKHFSQNFLVDKNAQTKVAKAMQDICDLSDGFILEIGPGQGDVTKNALKWNKNVLAIEFDLEAVQFLQNEITAENFEIIYADAMVVLDLKMDEKRKQKIEKQSYNEIKTDETLKIEINNSKIKQIQQQLLSQNFTLISSLPYHIGSRLLVDFGVNFPDKNFAVIHQKEVVTKTQQNQNFTFFGAWLNIFWDCKYCFDLPKHCFFPQPNVISAVLQGRTKNSQKKGFLNTSQKREFAKTVLKKLFAFPSKTLINNLRGLDWKPEKIQNFIDSYCNGDQKIRLDWNNYQFLLEKIIESCSTNPTLSNQK